MFLQPNNPSNYDSVQQLATQVAILRSRLNMMRMDHPERDALLTEITTLQSQLMLVRQSVQAYGFTF
jgi:hypothetical protein